MKKVRETLITLEQHWNNMERWFFKKPVKDEVEQPDPSKNTTLDTEKYRRLQLLQVGVSKFGHSHLQSGISLNQVAI